MISNIVFLDRGDCMHYCGKSACVMVKTTRGLRRP